MKKLKKASLTALTLMLLASSGTTAYAAMPGAAITGPTSLPYSNVRVANGVTPRWDYLVMMSAGMEIDNNKALITVCCESNYKEVDKMVVKCELQQYDGGWKTIKSWQETENDWTILFEKTYGVYKNYSYQIKLTAKAYKDGSLLESATEYFPYGYYN